MAWFTYKCEEHGKFKVSLTKREKLRPCPTCSKDACAIIQLGTTRIVERLDNGAMARAVERLHNVEEIMEERANKHAESEPEGDT
jgi:hypothetical protein